MDWSAEFRERVEVERRAGTVHCVYRAIAGLGLSHSAPKPTDIADAIARHAGLRALGDSWRVVSADQARSILADALHHDAAYGVSCMPETRAAAFAEEFVDHFGAAAAFLTNQHPAAPAVGLGSESCVSWSPLTAGTFDTGIVGIAAAAAALFCVEDED